MVSRVREALQRLGVIGSIFAVGSVLLVILYWGGFGLASFIDILFLIPFGIVLAIRGIIYLKRHSLWSLRNRLLLAYGLLGVLPMLLLYVLAWLTSWALMNELAIYLASSALDRRIDSVQAAVETLRGIPPEHRDGAASQIQKAFDASFPGIMFFITDGTGTHRYPADAPTLNIPSGWKATRGLLVLQGHFFGWSHFVDDSVNITAIAPFTNRLIESLVPNLGEIALVETHAAEKGRTAAATAGSLEAEVKRSSDGQDPNFRFRDDSSGRHVSKLPPAMGRLDIPVFIPSTRPHYHLNAPGKTFDSVLWVYSRPSAVMHSFFSGGEVIRDFLLDALIAVAILFLLVELVAVWIGVSLSRRITNAVNQLYEGTRRVIQGDFRHRIAVRDQDQLSELAQSFNHMTGNLERLLSIEKEKERLETELEIAREVQAQLYPKEAPPTCGLQLTVECDPARMVSGDYYDYLQFAPGKLAFAIGDVAGKGISAALLMATLQAALRAQISTYTPLSSNDCSDLPEVNSAVLVSKLNKQIYAHTAPEKYATFFFALFNEQSRTLSYTNAGHLSPLLFRNGNVIPLDSNGTVVGAFPFAEYDESCLIMERGDLLVCYTDGITEPENAFGEMFGEERLIELVKKHAHRKDREILNIVLDSVRSWTGSPELHDDMTLLIAREVSAA